MEVWHAAHTFTLCTACVGERCALIALARASTHPLARAITDGLGAIEAANAIDLREQPGMGLVAVIDGKTARLGRPDWVGVPAAEVQTATAFRWGDRPARLIRFADTLRADAPAAMPRLKAMGFAPILVSGDRYAPVAAIAASIETSGLIFSLKRPMMGLGSLCRCSKSMNRPMPGGGVAVGSAAGAAAASAWGGGGLPFELVCDRIQGVVRCWRSEILHEEGGSERG